MQDTFRAAYDELYRDHPGDVFRPWMAREFGMVKKCIIKGWRGTPEECHAFVRWAVENWSSVIHFRFKKIPNAPKLPEIGFLCRCLLDFRQAQSKDLTAEWIKTLPDHEQREMASLTQLQGLTKEAALAEIGRNRAREEMREEVEREKNEARKLRVAAEIAVASAEQRERVRSMIHPESETGKELASLRALKRRVEHEAAMRAAGKLPAEDPLDLDPNWQVPDFTNLPEWQG